MNTPTNCHIGRSYRRGTSEVVNYKEGLGATYATQEAAEQTLKHLNQFGIVGRLVKDGTFYRIDTRARTK